MAIARSKFASPSRLRRELGQEVDDWFRRALNVNPDKRFPSAKELASSFGQLVAGISGRFSALTTLDSGRPPSSGQRKIRLADSSGSRQLDGATPRGFAGPATPARRLSKVAIGVAALATLVVLGALLGRPDEPARSAASSAAPAAVDSPALTATTTAQPSTPATSPVTSSEPTATSSSAAPPPTRSQTIRFPSTKRTSHVPTKKPKEDPGF